MKNSCRIGKVTFKNKTLTAFPNNRLEGNRLALIEHAREIAGIHKNMEGWIIIAWDPPIGNAEPTTSCHYSSGSRKDGADLPNFAAETIRQNFLQREVTP